MSFSGMSSLHEKFRFVAKFPTTNENNTEFSVVADEHSVQCLKEVWSAYCNRLTSPKRGNASIGDLANVDTSDVVEPTSKIALAAHVLLSVLQSLSAKAHASTAEIGSSIFSNQLSNSLDLYRSQALRVVFTEFSQLCKSEPHTAAAMVRIDAH